MVVVLPSDTGKRDIRWNPVGAGLVYLEGEAAPAGRGGAAGRGGRGAPGGGNGGGAAANRKDRVFTWAPPFGASDAKQIFEANSRITSAEFSPDGQMLFVNEGSDLYAVKLADPTQALRDREGRDDRGRRPWWSWWRRRGGWWPWRRAERFGVLQRAGRAPDQAWSARGAGRSSERRRQERLPRRHEVLPDWTKQAPHNFVDKVDIETGAKTRLFEGKGDIDGRHRRAAGR